MPVDTYREAPTALPAVAQDGSLDPEDGGKPLVHMLVASQAREEPLPPDWQLTVAADHPSTFVEVAGMIKPLVEQYSTMLRDLSTQAPHTTAERAPTRRQARCYWPMLAWSLLPSANSWPGAPRRRSGGWPS